MGQFKVWMLLLLGLGLVACPAGDDDDSSDDDDDDDDAAGDDDDDATGDVALIFSAMGDVPYSDTGEDVLADQVLAHNDQSQSSFVVHLGDIKPGAFFPCNEAVYSTASSLLLGLDARTFIIPGDNEWNDCADPDAAWLLWEQYFSEFDANWPDGPTVDRQDVRNENFAFMQNGILLIGINIPGGAVHDAAEWTLRLGQDADWVDAQFAAHADADAAVVFGHASPTPTHDEFIDRFLPAVAAWTKPVLYLHGDGHVWEEQHPYFEDNLWRVQVDEGGVADPVEVSVVPGGDPPFVFDREPLE